MLLAIRPSLRAISTQYTTMGGGVHFSLWTGSHPFPSLSRDFFTLSPNREPVHRLARYILVSRK